jgi:hypothetical protein
VRHFTERGTEVAVYDYAKYNENILHNHSVIICFKPDAQSRIGFPDDRFSYEKFKSRFQIIEIDDISEMNGVIDTYSIDVFYTLTHGGKDIYQCEIKDIWGNCKTIKHCVFDSTYPEGDFYIGINDYINKKSNTNIKIIPHIVDLPDCNENWRSILNIPNTSIVFGRHGGYHQFNMPMVHNAIKEFLKTNTDVYFLFLNTNKFYTHPRIIYIDKIQDDPIEKVRFINTCDAMIHGRGEGEMFSLAIGEFSIKNKPIITCPSGDTGHIDILREKGIYYRSKRELIHVFRNIHILIKHFPNWNAYGQYTPENVMNLFKEMLSR